MTLSWLHEALPPHAYSMYTSSQTASLPPAHEEAPLVPLSGSDKSKNETIGIFEAIKVPIFREPIVASDAPKSTPPQRTIPDDSIQRTATHLLFPASPALLQAQEDVIAEPRNATAYHGEFVPTVHGMNAQEFKIVGSVFLLGLGLLWQCFLLRVRYSKRHYQPHKSTVHQKGNTTISTYSMYEFKFPEPFSSLTRLLSYCLFACTDGQQGEQAACTCNDKNRAYKMRNANQLAAYQTRDLIPYDYNTKLQSLLQELRETTRHVCHHEKEEFLLDALLPVGLQPCHPPSPKAAKDGCRSCGNGPSTSYSRMSNIIMSQNRFFTALGSAVANAKEYSHTSN